MDEQQEVQQNNMISNLPLLFANGYPTSLDKIGERQLENFIPFMVQCSLGHINLQGRIDCSEPEWWPEDLPFSIPFSRPKKFVGDWIEKLKKIVVICYQFHKSVFLLRFCNDLASYEHASLRFINNYNSTTSLFDRRSNKLLVTFRNENMSYDQPLRSRKCLLQQKSKSGRPDGHGQMMVEPPPFDIYLCDNCDAELYSKEAILEHEKTCNVDDDDDVILCDTPEPEHHPSPELGGTGSNIEYNERRNQFLQNFGLQFQDASVAYDNGDGRCCVTDGVEINSGSATLISHEEAASAGHGNMIGTGTGFMIVGRNKRTPRRNRAVHSLTRCPTIPLSSPAGQMLLRTTKTALTSEYLTERLERTERFCHALPLTKSFQKPKYWDKKPPSNAPHCTFKKLPEYSRHMYVFPRRQYAQRRHKRANFLFLNSTLIRRCRPISVRLRKITDQDVKSRQTLPNTNAPCPAYTNTKLNIKLTRDTTRSSNWKISSSSAEVIVDTIDLCSSDEDDTVNSSARKVGGTAFAVVLSKQLSPSEAVAQKPSLPAWTTSAAKTSFARSRLKKMGDRLNSEVSLIPIHAKTAPKLNAIRTLSTSATILKVANVSSQVTATGDVPTADDRRRERTAHSERSSLPPPSIVEPVSEAAHTLPVTKPLRPSVYIFSNYTANPLAALMATANDLSSTPNGPYLRSHNQENHLTGAPGGGVNIAGKRVNNVGVAPVTAAAMDWFTGANSALSNQLSTAGSSVSNSGGPNSLIEFERSSRSITFVQNFGSPNRVVSIDLTS